MLATILRRLRIDVDIRQLIENKYHVTILNTKNELIIKFNGPKQTPYEGGIWKVRLYLPQQYPDKPPRIWFMNQIYHPNIDLVSGEVGLNFQNNNWKNYFTLYYLFEYCLPHLLVTPNPNDPLNSDAANMLLYNPPKYKRKVAKYTRKFANEDVLEAKEAANGEDGEQTATSQNGL